MVKKKVDLKPLTVDKLQVELEKTKQELHEARLSHAARELANPRRLSDLRHQIARLHTHITKAGRSVSQKEQA